MKSVVKVKLGSETMYFTPAAYKEWRFSLSTGDFHTHQATRIKRAPRVGLITDLNSLLLEQLMPELAAATGLTHDGSDDNRLFDETITADSKDMTAAEYAEMEREIEAFEIKGKGFVVYAWNDSSGYNYWCKQQQEHNYIQITAAIQDVRKVDRNALKIAIRRARNTFAKYDLIGAF